MKVEVNENKKVEEKPFPKLMIGKLSLAVVLFNKPKEGVSLIANEVYETGHYSNDWDMQYFQDFNGSITLSND